jgi:diguanylate cyclase (GGDEF)-like protein
MGVAQGGEELSALLRRNDELEILFEALTDLASTLSVDEVAERLLDRTLSLLASRHGALRLISDESDFAVVASRGISAAATAERLRPGEGIAGIVAETRSVLLSPDASADPRLRGRTTAREFAGPLLCAPLVLAGAVIGVIEVSGRTREGCYGAEEAAWLERIAGYGAVALGNARRYEQVLGLSKRDALTGLADHAYFWWSLDLELRRAAQFGRDLALALFDLDRFRAYNERHGHLAGDQALVAVARVLRQRSRAHDTFARFGGKQIAALLPETNPAGAFAFAEKMRRAVEEEFQGRDASAPLTLSAGLCCWPLDTGGSTVPRQLVEVAQARLAEAKETGRNRTVGGRA